MRLIGPKGDDEWQEPRDYSPSSNKDVTAHYRGHENGDDHFDYGDQDFEEEMAATGVLRVQPKAQQAHQPRAQTKALAVQDEFSRKLAPEGIVALAKSAGGRVLTDVAINLIREGRWKEILFRDEEVSQLSDILVRREGKFPVVVGDTGSGKSAIFDQLAG